MVLISNVHIHSRHTEESLVWQPYLLQVHSGHSHYKSTIPVRFLTRYKIMEIESSQRSQT